MKSYTKTLDWPWTKIIPDVSRQLEPHVSRVTMLAAYLAHDEGMDIDDACPVSVTLIMMESLRLHLRTLDPKFMDYLDDDLLDAFERFLKKTGDPPDQPRA